MCFKQGEGSSIVNIDVHLYIHILISRWKNSSKKRGRVSVSDEDGLAVCCAGPVLAL